MVRPSELAVPRHAGSGVFRRSWRLRPLPATLLVGLGYLAASLALHHDVLPRLTTATTGRVTSDAYLFVWWLEWFPWALRHDLNPLFTTYQHYPVGVNAMWNTTVPALALLFAPVTLTAGPVAAFNVAMVLGPVVSGLALVAALRPYVTRLAPRAVAGLLYGFGPFMIAHASVGHLNLVWVVLPPVLLWAVHAVLVRPSAPLRTGALLGVAFAVQTALYSQTVALGAIALVVTAAVLALRRPRAAAARLPDVARAALACAGTYVLLCAYPLYELLAGGARPRASIRDPAETGADALNTAVPTELTALRFGTDDAAAQMRAHLGEQGGYLGVAVLVVVVAAAARGLVRSTVARVAATVGAILFVLSLGASLVVGGHDTGIPLPWALVHRIPLVGQAEAVRLQIFVALCVAVVVAVWLDRLLALRRTAAVGVTLAALVTWVPADAQVATPVTVPAFFTHAATEQLAPDDVVETVPRPTGEWVGGADPLLWQAASGMAYRMTGGYFIGSDARHDLLLEAPAGEFQRGVDAVAAGQDMPRDAAARVAARGLRAAGVTVVLVVDRAGVEQAGVEQAGAEEAGAARQAVLAWTRRVTGVPGRRVEDVWLFRLSSP